MSRHRYVAIGVLVIVLIAAATTFVFAQSSEPDVIHACVSTKNGSIKIVDPDDVCGKFDYPLQWRSTPGLQYSYTRWDSLFNGPGETIYFAEHSAYCDEGDIAIGGGVYVWETSKIMSSRPAIAAGEYGTSGTSYEVPNGWTVTVNALAQNNYMTVYVTCSAG